MIWLNFHAFILQVPSFPRCPSIYEMASKQIRVLRLILKGVCLSAVWGIGLLATAATQSNPIEFENQEPGTSN